VNDADGTPTDLEEGRMDAFVFVREVSGPIAGDLRALVPEESNPVRYVTTLSGRYDAMLALEAESLGELQSYVLDTIHGQRQLATETAIQLVEGPLRIKRLPAREIECFVRIKAEPGRAQEVLEGTSGLPGYQGSAIVAAEFDVLLELGGSTFEEVAGALLQMHRIEGIRSSASSFAASEAEGSRDGA
jgi:hypothetical protein